MAVRNHWQTGKKIWVPSLFLLLLRKTPVPHVLFYPRFLYNFLCFTMQAHCTTSAPSLAPITDCFTRYLTPAFFVSLTELDASLCAFGTSGVSKKSLSTSFKASFRVSSLL